MDGMQVLIIEDDKDTAEFFSTVLGLVGYQCETVLSARDALARLAVEAPDLILLDLRLGMEVGGEHILYQLRSNPRFDNTRVIIITAYPGMAQPVSNLADLVLLKPVDVDQLRTLAERLGSFQARPKHLAFRDPISELYTREFFDTRLELAFERARRRPDFFFGVMVFLLEPQTQLDPDGMLAVLRDVGERMRRTLRLTDTVARSAGWKFVTLHEEMKQAQDIRVIEQRLRGVLSEPYLVSAERVEVRLYFGSAVHQSGFQRPEDIMLAAEAALQQVLLEKEKEFPEQGI